MDKYKNFPPPVHGGHKGSCQIDKVNNKDK